MQQTAFKDSDVLNSRFLACAYGGENPAHVSCGIVFGKESVESVVGEFAIHRREKIVPPVQCIQQSIITVDIYSRNIAQFIYISVVRLRIFNGRGAMPEVLLLRTVAYL